MHCARKTEGPVPAHLPLTGSSRRQTVKTVRHREPKHGTAEVQKMPQITETPPTPHINFRNIRQVRRARGTNFQISKSEQHQVLHVESVEFLKSLCVPLAFLGHRSSVSGDIDCCCCCCCCFGKDFSWYTEFKSNGPVPVRWLLPLGQDAQLDEVPHLNRHVQEPMSAAATIDCVTSCPALAIEHQNQNIRAFLGDPI